MSEERLRIWITSAVLAKEVGLTTNVHPRNRVTLAYSEDEAIGGLMRWLAENWPGHAVHSVGAWPVPDDMVLRAAEDITP